MKTSGVGPGINTALVDNYLFSYWQGIVIEFKTDIIYIGQKINGVFFLEKSRNREHKD